MRTRVTVVAVVLAVAVGIVVFATRPGVFIPKPPLVDANSIVLLGDSITEEGDWAVLLPELPVVNAGRSGWTTHWLVPLARDIAAEGPRMVIILAGTNDIRDDRPPAWTRRYLGEMVDAIQAGSPATRIVLQTILPRADRVDDVRAANMEIAALANERGIELLDLYEPFDDGHGGLRAGDTYDGVHLTAAGYTRWVGLLRPLLAAE